MAEIFKVICDGPNFLKLSVFMIALGIAVFIMSAGLVSLISSFFKREDNNEHN